MSTQTDDSRRPTPNKLACQGCGRASGLEQVVAGRWLCGGCVQKMAEWAIEQGALLAYGDAPREDEDEHTVTDS